MKFRSVQNENGVIVCYWIREQPISWFAAILRSSTMPDYKKFEEVDIFISGRPTPEGDKAVSEYIVAYKDRKARKEKEARKKNARPVPLAAKKLRATAK